MVTVVFSESKSKAINFFRNLKNPVIEPQRGQLSQEFEQSKVMPY